MAIPQVFRKTGDLPLRYDYQDVLTGKAYQKFYGLKAGTTYHLSGLKIDSIDVITEGITNLTAYTKVIDNDFDIGIEQSQMIEGDAIISLTHGLLDRSNDNVDSYCIIKLRTYDGTTETDLATYTSATLSLTASGVNDAQRITAPFAITRTKLKPGMILRITVEVWLRMQADTGDDAIAWYAHDPNGRTIITSEITGGAALGMTDSHSTVMEAIIPFVLH